MERERREGEREMDMERERGGREGEMESGREVQWCQGASTAPNSALSSRLPPAPAPTRMSVPDLL